MNLREHRPVWVQRFLVVLLDTRGDVQRSAALVGIGRTTVYEYRQRSPRFREQMEQVRDQIKRRAA